MTKEFQIVILISLDNRINYFFQTQIGFRK